MICLVASGQFIYVTNLAPQGVAQTTATGSASLRLNPAGIDQDDLELYLIDHGLDEMGEGSGEHGEPQLVIDFHRLLPAAHHQMRDEHVRRRRRAVAGAGWV